MTAAYQLIDIECKYTDEMVIGIDQYDFEQNETHVLTGPNGSGKTTLLNVLSLLNKPASGDIYVLGEKVTEENRLMIRRRIGYVEQRPYLFNLTVKENIAIGLKLRGMSKSLCQSRTANIVDQLGLTFLQNKRAHELSGGEMQKIALARALVLEPEILILDEPFTYLDKAFSAELEQLLMNMRENRSQTIILSAHDHLRAHLLGDHVCSVIDGTLIDESNMNLFHGQYQPEDGVFTTGNIKIVAPTLPANTTLIAVEPREIVLSREALHSSMRNSFNGVVSQIENIDDLFEITVRAGERIRAVISEIAMRDLAVKEGETLWASFKSSVVRPLR